MITGRRQLHALVRLTLAGFNRHRLIFPLNFSRRLMEHCPCDRSRPRGVPTLRDPSRATTAPADLPDVAPPAELGCAPDITDARHASDEHSCTRFWWFSLTDRA